MNSQVWKYFGAFFHVPAPKKNIIVIMFTTGFQGIFLAQCVGRNFLGKLCSYGFLEGNVTPGVE